MPCMRNFPPPHFTHHFSVCHYLHLVNLSLISPRYEHNATSNQKNEKEITVDTLDTTYLLNISSMLTKTRWAYMYFALTTCPFMKYPKKPTFSSHCPKRRKIIFHSLFPIGSVSRHAAPTYTITSHIMSSNTLTSHSFICYT